MPVLTGRVEMNDLAQKLAKMRFWRAKWYAYGLDKKAHYDMWRVGIGTDEYHTRLTLPTLGLRISLIERKEQVGQPNSRGLVRMRFRYVEARVEPMPTPVPETTEEYLRLA
ncbi:MAG: hypothetical protein ACYDBJ_28545 [Aggregatilineales bacterium]